MVRTSVTHSAIASCATFLFLPHFDVISSIAEQTHGNMESICYIDYRNEAIIIIIYVQSFSVNPLRSQLVVPFEF